MRRKLHHIKNKEDKINKWIENYKKLKEYKKINSNLCFPIDYKEDLLLVNLVNAQHYQYNLLQKGEKLV